MAWALFLVVAGIWAVFLLPPLWADRRPSFFSPTRRQALDGPGRHGGTPPNTYQSPSHPVGGGVGGLDRAAVVTRRRRALTIFVGTALVSLVAVVVFGGRWLLVLHGAADALLIWYVVMLRRITTASREMAALAAVADDEVETPRVRVVGSS